MKIKVQYTWMLHNSEETSWSLPENVRFLQNQESIWVVILSSKTEQFAAVSLVEIKGTQNSLAAISYG